MDLVIGTLTNEDLIDIQQNVAALDDHTLHCQVLPQVFCLADLKQFRYIDSVVSQYFYRAT